MGCEHFVMRPNAERSQRLTISVKYFENKVLRTHSLGYFIIMDHHYQHQSFKIKLPKHFSSSGIGSNFHRWIKIKNTFMIQISLLQRVFQRFKDELHMFSEPFLVQIVFKMLNQFCTFINKQFQSRAFHLQISLSEASSMCIG